MKTPFPIAISARFYPRQRDLAAAGIYAPAEDRSQVIVDGRREDDQSRVRQDKAPAPSARGADGKPLSAHRFFRRVNSAKRPAMVPDRRQHPDIPDVLWHQSPDQGEGAHVG
ncbi:MAG: hypothetical protein P1U65_01045 [Minwuia sp.]|nr:hypothetical protein [Minwuia sp.]